jgi:hypothetical protein
VTALGGVPLVGPAYQDVPSRQVHVALLEAAELSLAHPGVDGGSEEAPPVLWDVGEQLGHLLGPQRVVGATGDAAGLHPLKRVRPCPEPGLHGPGEDGVENGAERIHRGRRGAGPLHWLSAVRNDIQYRHARGLWLPETMSRGDRTTLSRLAGQWQGDPCRIQLESPSTGELGMFVVAAAFLVALCRDLLQRVGERASVRTSFVDLGPLHDLARRKVGRAAASVTKAPRKEA